MKYLLRLQTLAIMLLAFSCSPIPYGREVTIDEAVLADKVRGGWFAQTIGCTYGSTIEFRYFGNVVPDTTKILWYDDFIHDTFRDNPGMFDDVYMDLTFMEVMLDEGRDAPASSYATRYANAPYCLWHANQAGRHNVLFGKNPPESGYWKNNPHADDIDFQIESDFIGMVCPGRPNDAAALCDSIGHIMNYGDGWYGGVMMGAMYSLAYVCDDVQTVVEEAIPIIPAGTKFRNIMDDALASYKSNPDDWKAAWQVMQEKYRETDFCPHGVLAPFNIDAALNASYVVIGLLYGGGDFFRTMDITTRCGDDADCNAATAVGILSVIKGYNAIPEEFKRGAEVIADEQFPFTSLTLNTACEKTLELIGTNTFKVQKPVPVRYEQSFEGLKPLLRRNCPVREFADSCEIEFEGNSAVISGQIVKNREDADESYNLQIKAYLDGELAQEYLMPCNNQIRRDDGVVFFQYDFGSGPHKLKLVIDNPTPDFKISMWDIVTFDSAD